MNNKANKAENTSTGPQVANPKLASRAYEHVVFKQTHWFLP